jgi:hypothetical protein
MCISNVVSDDKTMSGDELEACSWEIATVANRANQSSPFITATDSGDVETMLEAEDFCAGGIECTLQNEDHFLLKMLSECKERSLIIKSNALFEKQF